MAIWLYFRHREGNVAICLWFSLVGRDEGVVGRLPLLKPALCCSEEAGLRSATRPTKLAWDSIRRASLEALQMSSCTHRDVLPIRQ